MIKSIMIYDTRISDSTIPELIRAVENDAAVFASIGPLLGDMLVTCLSLLSYNAVLTTRVPASSHLCEPGHQVIAEDICTPRELDLLQSDDVGLVSADLGLQEWPSETSMMNLTKQLFFNHY